MGLFGNRKITQETFVKKILIGGEAGEGIKTSGKIISKLLLKAGMDVFLYDEYPSLIRGGHNSVHVNFSEYQTYGNKREIDVLVCFNRETFDLHKSNLCENSIVIFDSGNFKITESDLFQLPCELIDIPVTQVLHQTKLPRIVLNTIYIACTLNILGISEDNLIQAYGEVFYKNQKTLDQNILAVKNAYVYSQEYSNYRQIKQKKPSEKDEVFISGNESIGLGAVHGGVSFYAGYPMTPSSTILDFMFKYSTSNNIFVKQTEDEISAINMVIGASFAGARSMTATSGGGFSLMTEGLGLAAITELPIVVVIAQRPGPSTGMPTWTGQSDLLFALNSSQDEFPRIILTPTDAEECFEFGFLAFNLADKYQIPVIIMTDKYLAESYVKFKPEFKNKEINRGMLFNTRMLSRLDNFKRYEFTKDGVSPRSLPGMDNGIYIANSDESDEFGFSNEESANRKAKMEKRFTKVKTALADMPIVNLYGDGKPDFSIITWGSSKGACLEAVRRLQNNGLKVKLLALNYIEPFPKDEVVKFINTSKKLVLVEGNYGGQLGKLISMYTGFDINNKLTKFDGRPIFPDEVFNKVLDK